VSGEDQGKTFAAFAQRELEAERERRKAFDARGVAVVTTAASLTTLLAAVGAFVSSRQGFKLPGSAVVPLIVTLGSFVAAAVLGIAATWLTRYAVTPPATLGEMLTTRWRTDEVDARNFVAVQDVKTIKSLRNGNNKKSWWLIAALVVQVVGLLALSVAVYLILSAAS
jgi:hypothetical protein